MSSQLLYQMTYEYTSEYFLNLLAVFCRRQIFSYMHHNVYSCFIFNELRYIYMNTTCDYSGETWNVLEQEMLGVNFGDNDFIKIFNIANLNIVTDIDIKIHKNNCIYL